MRSLADSHASKIDIEYRKKLKITKSEDISYVLYVNHADIAIMLDMELQNGNLQDISFRGGDIETIVYKETGEYPPDCSVINWRDIRLGILWMINDNPKCPRCWKRYAEVHLVTKLCSRCHSVVAEIDKVNQCKEGI